MASGYWPLFRYNPAMRETGANPFRLDSPRPTMQFRDYAYNEVRYKALAQTAPGGGRAAAATPPSKRSTRSTACTRTWPAGRTPASIRPTPA